ncbi:MAG: histidine phosphatase family protein [Alphaproteobacteria bacterium]
MQIILSRHGNTFKSTDIPVWAGLTEDFPLVKKGREQARICAEAIRASGIEIADFYVGTLKRHKDYAGIIIEELGLNKTPIIDERLNEIYYGKWSGLSNHEIVEKHSAAELEGWNKKSIWPVEAEWGSSEAEVVQKAQDFAAEITQKYTKDEIVLVVSSNGVLRYFLRNIDGLFEKKIEDGTFKMRTGYLSKFEVEENNWTLKFWNHPPEILV